MWTKSEATLTEILSAEVKVLDPMAHSNRPQYRASTAITTTFLDNNDVIGARPVMTHQ